MLWIGSGTLLTWDPKRFRCFGQPVARYLRLIPSVSHACGWPCHAIYVGSEVFPILCASFDTSFMFYPKALPWLACLAGAGLAWLAWPGPGWPGWLVGLSDLGLAGLASWLAGMAWLT